MIPRCVLVAPLLLLAACDPSPQVSVDRKEVSPETDPTTPDPDDDDPTVDEDDDGWAATDDCDDSDPAVHPQADEVCDGVDNDCDGIIDEGLDQLWYADADADGYGDHESTTEACAKPEGYAANATDCDDSRADVNPAAQEVCDGADNDCDDETDEGVTSTFYGDEDGDGFGNPHTPVQACQAPDMYVDNAEDCDDAQPTAHPDHAELCDELDNDCDGDIDEDDAEDAVDWYADSDGDGFGDAKISARACTAPSGYVSEGTDCDDTDPETWPGAAERCDGADNDCDGDVDEDLMESWYADADGDGFGDASTGMSSCDPGSGWVADETDCDDSDASINPDAEERCGGGDEDCDGVTDEADAVDAGTWYADQDGDGYGDPATGASACTQPSGTTSDDSDCDDSDANIRPGVKESCDGIDDNCDGDVDEGATSTWYADGDGDGYGDSASSSEACEAPSGHVAVGGDCDDGDASIHPDAEEVCDGVDNDCDGDIDEEGDTGDTGGAEQDSGQADSGQTDSGTPGDSGADSGLISCPSDMVSVADSFCIDTYEASRPDASASSAGSDESAALSQAGVLPWQVADNATAEAACVAAGKRLCSEDEWYQACSGSAGTVYSYGDAYEAATCNGLDTHCSCKDGSVYEDCYFDCGGSIYLEVTGSFPACTNEYGALDLNGNLWEHVAGGSDYTVRGGAYNCGDSPTYHQCSYIPTSWTPSARGFRCCLDGE